MNHQVARKAFPARDPNKPTALRQTKTSVDSNEKPRSRSKSKNKIPKNVRYDLDNALVSLCDVWFEEIKPYLVRNNIKVHVHEAKERREDAAAGAGDRECSHRDPGAVPDHRRHRSVNCADYYSTQPIASKALCRKPRTPLAPLQEPRPCPSIQIPCPNYYEDLEPKTRKCSRRRRPTKTHHLPPQNLVPRLCRTYSILPQTTLQNSIQKNQAQKRGTKTNKSHISEKSYIPGVNSKKKSKNIQTEKLTEIDLKTEAHVENCPKSYGRRYGTGMVSFFPDQSKKNNIEHELHDLSPLFKNDLIDIIAKKNEKRLQLLFKSPASEYYPSTMNLLPSPISNRLSAPPRKPWR